MNEKKLESFLTRPGTALADLAERARRMQTLTGVVRSALPPEDRAHLVSAGLREDETLVLVADSSAWAARFRFLSEDAVAAAQAAGFPATECRVTVRPRREDEQG
ncbi:MAG: DciA family protein [Gammaproteobacteria bacterium]